MVEVEHVSKRFRRQTVQPSTTLKTAIVDFLRRRRRRDEEATFQVLRDISFVVQPGQTLGIIGRNGSGKSTLLKLLAGIFRPDHGRIVVHGRVGALLELGTGFHPEFSGRENVLINGIVLGLSKREVRRRFDAIVHFAELEDFIDEPVKTYSSGMYMRLGFSVAVHADPEILLIDEVLGVGDESFQQKCLDKMSELRFQGKTIVLVSHDLASVERLSNEVLWIKDGTVHEYGVPQRVIEHYRDEMTPREPWMLPTDAPAQDVAQKVVPFASGRGIIGDIEILSASMVDVTGAERYVYQSGESTSLLVHYRVHRPIEAPVFGFAIFREDGLQCYGSTTSIDGADLPALGLEGVIEVSIERLDVLEGAYSFDVTVQAVDGRPDDLYHRLCSFTVTSDRRDVGVFRVPHHWAIRPLSAVPHQLITPDLSGTSMRA